MAVLAALAWALSVDWKPNRPDEDAVRERRAAMEEATAAAKIKAAG